MAASLVKSHCRTPILSAFIFALLVCEVARADDAPPTKPKLLPLPAKVPEPKDNPATPAKIALGRQLFFDARLSAGNDTSCGTCHIPDKGFADGLPLSKGFAGKPLARNTPGLLNLAFFSPLLWDGRAKSLEEQALLPIQSDQEMHQELAELEKELHDVPEYAAKFQDAFGGQATSRRIGEALAAYQRTLVSRNSPLDRYLAGDKDALSPAARHGMELFVGEAGCIRCHHGPLLSDGEFYRLGVEFRDKGLGAVTGKKDDLYKFRTPPLRDVARTAPYMHDGSVATLEQVVEFYFRGVPSAGPDGLKLDVEPVQAVSFMELGDVVEFLKSLNGELPKDAAPRSP